MVYVKARFPQPCVGEFILVCAEDVLPMPCHLSTLLMPQPHPTAAPYILFLRDEVAGHVLQSVIVQHRCQLFLALILRLLKPCVQIAHQDDVNVLLRHCQRLFNAMNHMHVF